MLSHCTRILPALLLGLLAMAPGQDAAAKIYKWVDENGVTQYTEYPPPRGEAEEVAPAPQPTIDPAAARKALQERLDRFNERRDARLQDTDSEEAERAERELVQAQCERIRENLTVLETNPRVSEEAEDGTRVRLTAEQREEKIRLFTTQLQENCG